MDGRINGRRRLYRRGALGMALAGLWGCGQTPTADTGPAEEATAAHAETPSTPGLIWASNWNQTFEEAVTTRASAGANRPVRRTLAGRSTAFFRAEVEKIWPTIRLTDETGKLAPIPVVLDTAAGRIELALFPDAAPNHVRNFLALAQVGFYDGLVFERSIRQEMVARTLPDDSERSIRQVGFSEDSTDGRVELVTAGCPNGDGDVGTGHIGYFLKPEHSALGHEEGTLGFWRDDDPNSAGTRFYICLAPAPYLNDHFTAFGKVTRGLDVVRAIAAKPSKDPTRHPESEQAKEPVAIKSVRRN